MTLLIVVLVFGGMVFIHELGHFLAAKIVNIEVEEFGFGLPPKILTLFRWQGTDFTLNALPLGGFVRPKGENDPNVMDGLSAANPWKRLFVLFAGPMMNLITAVFVTAIIVSQIGMADKKVLIDNVVVDSPAAQVGLLPNDMILAINGQEVTDPSAARLLIKDGVDTELTMIVERDGEQLSFAVTPLSTRPAELGALGVGLTSPRRPATFAETITSGVAYTGAQAMSILYMPIGLIQGVISPDEARLIGMKGIYDIFDQAVAKDSETRAADQTGQPTTNGTEPSYYVLSIVAMLSTSLAVFNLLPIPALDGGRILFTMPEILFKKRIPYKLENYVNGIAFLLLIAMMVIVNAMDFINPIQVNLP
jgi:regulator of sigma E protease